MVLDFNIIHVPQDWRVCEISAPIFSRVYYVIGGEVEYTDKNGTFFLEPDHLYLFPTAIPYTMTQNVRNKLYCMFLHLETAPDIIKEVIDINLAENSLVRSLVDSMWHTMHLALKETQPIISSLAEALMIYAKGQGFIKANSPRLYLAVEYIAANYKEKIPVETLSSLCGYHEKYFIKLFKDTFGVSPHQYIANYRLTRACYQLRSGLSVTETAYQCGYADAKGFCRAFKEKFGFSPMNYVKNQIAIP